MQSYLVPRSSTRLSEINESIAIKRPINLTDEKLQNFLIEKSTFFRSVSLVDYFEVSGEAGEGYTADVFKGKNESTCVASSSE